MSPESVGMLTVTLNSAESPTELKRQLDRERGLRLILEEQVRQLENQLENQLFQQQQQQQPTQIFEMDEVDAIGMQLVAAESLPVGHTQTVVCSPPTSRTSSPVTVLPEQRYTLIILCLLIIAQYKIKICIYLASLTNSDIKVNTITLYMYSNWQRNTNNQQFILL